jgi:hypothetical protein
MTESPKNDEIKDKFYEIFDSLSPFAQHLVMAVLGYEFPFTGIIFQECIDNLSNSKK